MDNSENYRGPGMPYYNDAVLERLDLQEEDVPHCWSDYWHGWKDIIIDLEAALAVTDPDFKFHQIKQKFGILRIYTTPLSDAGNNWLHKQKNNPKLFVLIAAHLVISRDCAKVDFY